MPFFLAGGPALVEGRGERVTPLGWLRGRDPNRDGPALLLVTPAVQLSPPPRCSGPGTRARAWPEGPPGWPPPTWRRSSGAASGPTTSWRGPPSSRAANDLVPAAAVVEPALIPFRRALLRLLGRPVGLSGSGPTHWALYASHAEAAEAADRVREAIAAGTLAAPGPRAPFVTAARILARTTEPANPRREP